MIDTAPTDARKAEITAIVSEEMDAMYAEQDRHRSSRFDAPNYNWRFCRCGWEAPHASKDAVVSVGVHVWAAQLKARKVADANIKRRMDETRRVTR